MHITTIDMHKTAPVQPHRHARAFLLRFFCWCLYLHVLPLCAVPLHADTADPAEHTRRLIIGGEYDYPPFSFLDKNGDPAGFTVELTRAIAKTMELDITIRLGPWNKMRTALEEGSIDAVQGMYYSPARDRVVDFSPPFLMIEHTLFARRGTSSVESIEGVAYKTVVVMRGDIMHDYLKQQDFSVRLITAPTPADVLRLLSEGAADYALAAKKPALYGIDRLALHNIVIAGPPVLSVPYCYAVGEGNRELLARLRQGLLIIEENGTFQTIHNKWLSTPHGSGPFQKDILRYTLYAGIPLAVIICFGVVWVWTLRKNVSARTRALQAENAERLRAEHDLKNHFLFLQTLINTIPSPVFYKDLQGRYTGCNKAFEAFLGLSSEEIIGKSVFDIAPPDTAAQYHDKDAELFRAPCRQTYESVVHRKGGEIRNVIFNKASLVDESGRVIGLVGIILDITDIRRAEEKVKESETRFRLAFENAQDAILWADAQTGIIINCNPAAEHLFEQPRQELIGRHHTALHPADKKDIYEQMFKTHIEKGSDKPAEADIVTGSGTVKPVTINESTTRVQDKSVIQGIFRDITAQKQQETELIQAKETAESASRAKSDFLARMSHEIRTPINSIVGMADILSLTDMTDKQHSCMQTIRHAADHLLTVINDILDFSRIESGKIKLHQRNIDFHALLHSVTLSMQVQAQQKNLGLTLDIDETAPRYIQADPDRIRQILFNLIGNAVKFTDSGSVSLRAAIAPGHNPKSGGLLPVRVSIQDTGVGIPHEKQKSVFEHFTQVDESLIRQHGGSGLGLSIVKQLVELMGGAISLTSEPGKGSEFSFTVPVLPGVPDEDASGPLQQHYEKTAPRSILLAEDNPLNIQMTTLALEEMGHSVKLATTGQEVLESLKQHSFDLILMDLEMPGIDGLEASLRIRRGEAGEQCSAIPIIAITGHVTPEYKEKCLSAGMNDYLTKPIELKKLADAIGTIRINAPSAKNNNPSQCSGGPHINTQHALDKLQGRTHLLDKLNGIFLQQIPQILHSLEAAIQQKNCDDIAYIAHTHKSSADMIGALPCRDLFIDLEHAAHNKDLAAAQDHFARLQAALEEIKQYLA